MTIGIGLCTNTGIVLAADSQETISGYTKGYRGKIRTILYPSTPRIALSFVGSGTNDYIDTATDMAIRDVSGLKNIMEVQAKLEDNLLSFFDKHLAPWAYFPDSDRPNTELLIAIVVGKAFRLLHYHGTAFHVVQYKAIGAGILLANSLITEYETKLHNTSLEQVASVAVHILSRVKKRVDTCGGQTDLVALRPNGDFAVTDFQEIERIEEALEKSEKEVAEELTKRIFAFPSKLHWMSDHKAMKGK